MNERMTRLMFVTSTALMFGACAMPQSSDSGGGGGRDNPQKKAHYNDPECKGVSCNIDVRIDCDWLGANCVAVVDPKIVLVFPDKAGSPKPKDIHWKLTGFWSKDYEFQDVELIPGKPTAFKCQEPGPHKKEAMCRDLFEPMTPLIEYTVHVVPSSGGTELTVDPWIVNR